MRGNHPVEITAKERVEMQLLELKQKRPGRKLKSKEEWKFEAKDDGTSRRISGDKGKAKSLDLHGRGQVWDGCQGCPACLRLGGNPDKKRKATAEL